MSFVYILFRYHSEIYESKKHEIKIDRDINASKYICIKNINKYDANSLKKF